VVERPGVVAVGVSQRVGEEVGADERDGGAAADGRAGGVGGVADEGDPPLRPAVHDDLADRVEVEVVGMSRSASRRGTSQPSLA
jgi:hypothetical protein